MLKGKKSGKKQLKLHKKRKKNKKCKKGGGFSKRNYKFLFLFY